MKKDRPSIIKTLGRCLSLRCPACGQASIVGTPFRIKQHCSVCGVVFNREEGFFVGAILVNIVTTEIVILLLYLISLPVISFNDRLVLAVLLGAAVLFPIAFYHHSWAIWLSFDHLVESLHKPGFPGR